MQTLIRVKSELNNGCRISESCLPILKRAESFVALAQVGFAFSLAPVRSVETHASCADNDIINHSCLRFVLNIQWFGIHNLSAGSCSYMSSRTEDSQSAFPRNHVPLSLPTHDTYAQSSICASHARSDPRHQRVIHEASSRSRDRCCFCAFGKYNMAKLMSGLSHHRNLELVSIAKRQSHTSCRKSNTKKLWDYHHLS